MATWVSSKMEIGFNQTPLAVGSHLIPSCLGFRKEAYILVKQRDNKTFTLYLW